MTPTVKIREAGIDVEGPSFTWEEAQEQIRCRIAWKACQRAGAPPREYTRREAQVADSRRRQLWLWVLAVCGSVCFAGAAYLAAAEGKAGIGLVCTGAMAAWAVFCLFKVPTRE